MATYQFNVISLQLKIPESLNVSEGLISISAMVNLDDERVVEVFRGETFRATEGMLKSLPAPIEPLTPEEEQHAIDIALSDPNVLELLDGREYNVSRAFSIPPMLKMEHWNISHHHLDGAVNDTDGGYAVQEIRVNTSSDSYASVRIDILNESANMTAYMTVVVNLNESIMERLSFEMSRGGGLMMSQSMPVSLTMTGGSYIAGTYEVNESENAGGMGYGISIFDAES